MLMPQCGHAQVEDFRRIELPGQQSLLGFVETEGGAQLGFAPYRPRAMIENEPGPLGDGLDDQRGLRLAPARVPGPTADAAERGVVPRVFPGRGARPEPDRARACRDAKNRS